MNRSTTSRCLILTAAASLAFIAGAEAKKNAAPKPAKGDPGEAGAIPMDFWLAEGQQPDKMQVMDFWKAESDKPTPLVFFIHGGAWLANDKDKVAGLRKYLPAGISVVSINYRFLPQAFAAGVKPPVKWPLE